MWLDAFRNWIGWIMAIGWEELELLLGVLEHRSLNRAAKAMRIGQATASRRLARLEEHAGAVLFDRTPEGLMPRALALEMAPHARLIAGHLSDIERVAAGKEAAPRGRVRLAVVDGFVAGWLASRIPTLLERFPELELDILSGAAVVDLVRQEAELAVRFVPPESADLVMRRLGGIDIGPFAAPSLGRRPTQWVALLDPAGAFDETRWLREHAAAERIIHVSHWADLYACVQQGVGAGLLPPLLAAERGLVPLDIPAPPVHRELLLVYHRAMRDVPRVSVVRDWLVEEAVAFTGGA